MSVVSIRLLSPLHPHPPLRQDLHHLAHDSPLRGEAMGRSEPSHGRSRARVGSIRFLRRGVPMWSEQAVEYKGRSMFQCRKYC